jgi:hybrid cluster-associated redox disulfide protein
MFIKEMTVGEAMNLHSDVATVFAAYHLGGCSKCSINEVETIEQVCQGYGVEVEEILESLNGLLGENEENYEE